MNSANVCRVTQAIGTGPDWVLLWWKDMRFLVKMVVLGFLALMALPFFAPQEYRGAADDNEAGPTPSAFELATMVGEAAADVRNICVRQPGVCETGGEIISYAGSRAREGLVVAYAMFRHGHPSMQQEEDRAETAAE